MRYTDGELEAAKIADLRADAEAAERQAEAGPFYKAFRPVPWAAEVPAITRESLLAYAKKCREEIAERQTEAKVYAFLKHEGYVL